MFLMIFDLSLTVTQPESGIGKAYNICNYVKTNIHLTVSILGLGEEDSSTCSYIIKQALKKFAFALGMGLQTPEVTGSRTRSKIMLLPWISGETCLHEEQDYLSDTKHLQFKTCNVTWLRSRSQVTKFYNQYFNANANVI